MRSIRTVRVKLTGWLCLLLLFQMLVPSSAWAHDTSKRDEATELQLYHKWLDLVEHSLIDQDVLESAYHQEDHSLDEPVDRATYVKWLMKTAVSKTMLDITFKSYTSCPFKDVNDASECKFLQFAKKMNVINGFPDGSFKPRNGVTRAEALALVAKILPYQLNNDKPREQFLDVDSGHWAYGAIELGVQLKLMNGFADGTFKPDQPATNSEIMPIIYNASKLLNQLKIKSGGTSPSPGPGTLGGTISRNSVYDIVWLNEMDKNIISPAANIPFEIQILTPKSDKFQLKWSANAGTIPPYSGQSATWTAPMDEGEYTVSVTVTWASGHETTSTQHFFVSNLALEQEFKFADPANFIPPAPDDVDSDGDGLMDYEETGLGTDPLSVDTDKDGLSDYLEAKALGTDPLQKDSNRDGIPDGVVCDSSNYARAPCSKS